jgi:hypothetical protein
MATQKTKFFLILEHNNNLSYNIAAYTCIVFLALLIQWKYFHFNHHIITGVWITSTLLFIAYKLFILLNKNKPIPSELLIRLIETANEKELNLLIRRLTLNKGHVSKLDLYLILLHLEH